MGFALMVVLGLLQSRAVAMSCFIGLLSLKRF